LFVCSFEIEDASKAQNAPNLEDASNAENAPNLEDASNAENASNLEGAPNAENAPNLENASNAENAPNLESAPNAENVPKTEDAPNLETSDSPEDKPPSGPCAEDIRQETGAVKQASQCPECSTLRQKKENLEYANECLKKEIEESMESMRVKYLTLDVYTLIENEIEVLLQKLNVIDVQIGPEEEDIFGSPNDVQIARQRMVEGINILNDALGSLLSENKELKIQLANIASDKDFVVTNCEESFKEREEALVTKGVKRTAEGVLSETHDKQVSHCFQSFG
jgi:hypothetical protein